MFEFGRDLRKLFEKARESDSALTAQSGANQ